MEEVLPQEIICEILLFLSPRELYGYGMTRRDSYRTSQIVCKMQLMQLLGGATIFHDRIKDGFLVISNKKEEIQSNSWFNLFFKEQSAQCIQSMKKLCKDLDDCASKEQKLVLMNKIYHSIYEQKDIYQTKKFQMFWETVYMKLMEFSRDEPQYGSIWDLHARRLFPERFILTCGEDLARLFETNDI
jgi:hypothetical protein